MKTNNLLKAFTGIAALMLAASCQDYEFGYTAQDVKSSVFKSNFEKEYGAISPDQSWDLTHYMTRTSKYDDEYLVNYLLQNDGQTAPPTAPARPFMTRPSRPSLSSWTFSKARTSTSS